MSDLVSAVRHELTEHIIPFWQGLKDEQHGGFISQVDAGDLMRHPEADKGCILNSRILWFFAEAAMQTGNRSLMDYADWAYAMLCRMTDEEHGGVYWSLHTDGTVADGTKHTYNQAFAIYALSAYYRAGGGDEALQRARALFETIETHCRDEHGYLEAFTADWRPESNEKLSENGVMAERTMNTLLHVLEGYTGLYQAWPDVRVRSCLMELLHILETKIYNPEKHRQEVFFDLDYHSLIDLHSYGHDIETSWLADRTLEILNDEELTARVRPLLQSLADETWHTALSDHGFANECERGKVDQQRVWWVQAEALLGFLNAWEKTGEERYQQAVKDMWDYISRVIIDHRPGSEWYWWVHEDGTPGERGIVDEWKCPYHNGRMCMEVMRRQPKF